MLLNFGVENYKSFLDKADFPMTKAPKQKGLDYSLFTEKIRGKNVKVLSSSVIYGPNASGKTNIIGAMDVFRAIILRGNIRNSEDVDFPNKAAYNLELIPNNISEEIKPTIFRIEFIDNGIKFFYELSILLGVFLDAQYERSVQKELLIVNDEMVFDRKETVEFGNLVKLKEYVTPQAINNIDTIKMMANEGCVRDELFLTNGFKLLISQIIHKRITNWFADKFMVIYRADALQIIRRFSDPQKGTIYIEKTTNDAAKLFGINSNSVAYVSGSEDGEARLCSIFPNDDKSGKAVLADIFESYGTIRFITLFPLVIRAIATGGTLVVDEFDASIHPMALMSIINAFHNDEINIFHAQLIFNTHNPIFLNSNIFRRDEIKFVEKNDDTLLSEIYSLSDFGTAGENGVRKGDDYMKNYFISQYGAIKSIDFTPVFEDIISEVSLHGN